MKNGTKIIITTLVLVVVGVGAVAIFSAPDNRTTNEHIGDAINKLDNGLDDAARELEDRTPAQRLSDEVKDATDGDAE